MRKRDVNKMAEDMNDPPPFATLNEKGQEVLDPTPMAPPLGYVKQPSIIDIIRDRVRTELSRRAAELGHDSFEDADDFDVGDDYDPKSPYEQEFDPPSNKVMMKELVEEAKKLEEAKKKKSSEEAAKQPPPKKNSDDITET